MSLRRAKSVLALVSYVLAVFVVPVLHRQHHLTHGADHVHTALGTIYTHETIEPNGGERDAGHYHAEFDRVWSELGLAEVAAAGTLTVDCAYTELTLAGCDATATIDHPRTFGDDLLARTHDQSHRVPEEDGHGAGSLEHTQASYLCVAPVVLPPPVQIVSAIVLEHSYESPALPLLRTRDSRGPPCTI